MSSRFTKKSLVSASGSLGKDAVLGLSEVGVQDAHAANEHRHFGCGQRQQLRLVNQQRLGRYGVFALEVVAEAVRDRFEYGEGLHIGLLLRGVHASRRRREPSPRDRHSSPLARRLRNQPKRSGQPARPSCRQTAALLNALWMPSRVFSTFASWAGWLTSQSFCGARRMRAPFAPPRLSEPRKVDADAQAVETSCETDSPEARILLFREAMSFSSINL